VYCEAEPVQGDRCLPPAKYTDVTLNNVASWIEELRQKAGDPVLLQIHEHLRDSLEFLPSPADSLPWRGLRLESG